MQTIWYAHTHTFTHSFTYVWNIFRWIFSQNQMLNDVLFHSHSNSSLLMLLRSPSKDLQRVDATSLLTMSEYKIKSIDAYDNDKWHLNKTNDTCKYSIAFFLSEDIRGRWMWHNVEILNGWDLSLKPLNNRISVDADTIDIT